MKPETTPTVVRDVFLNPGDYFFGPSHSRIRTLLGSCVSIILWHSERKVGGMCHYLLPSRGERPKLHGQLEGKYGEDAFQFLLESIKTHHLSPKDFIAKIFGGSDMFSKEEIILADVANAGSSKHVGARNIQFAKSILGEHKIPLISENTGGSTHRRVFFSVWNGEVYLETNQR